MIQSGTGTAANYGCPAAGKTGTTSNFTDAWFDGYTPKLATAVWVGYPNATESMADGFGGTLAAPIWHDFMQAAERRLSAATSHSPPSLARHPVHRDRFVGGKRPESGTTSLGSGAGTGAVPPPASRRRRQSRPPRPLHDDRRLPRHGNPRRRWPRRRPQAAAATEAVAATAAVPAADGGTGNR